jgi:hypothetical protein
MIAEFQLCKLFAIQALREALKQQKGDADLGQEERCQRFTSLKLNTLCCRALTSYPRTKGNRSEVMGTSGKMLERPKISSRAARLLLLQPPVHVLPYCENHRDGPTETTKERVGGKKGEKTFILL